MQSLLNDVRLSLRLLWSRPIFTAVAVLTIALGIGINTAIFSVVQGVLLSPLPFPEPERLVRVYPSRAVQPAEEGSGRVSARASFSLPDFRDWERQSTTLGAAGLYSSLPSGPLFTGGSEPLEVPTTYITAGFFEALGRAPHLGRLPSREEELGDNRVVVVSHGFWQRVLGGDPEAVGTKIQLDDQPFLVAGVMPTDFAFPGPETDLWMFLSTIPRASIPMDLRGVRFLEAVARLRPEVGLVEAEEELAFIAQDLSVAHPDTNGEVGSAQLEPLAESLTGGVSRQLLLLLATSGLILLLACANLAHLLLARGVERHQEMAVRAALGAGRGRLLRQLLTESTVLGALGGAVGLGFAFLVVPVLTRVGSEVLPRTSAIQLDGRVVGFAALATLLTGVFVGLLPALRATRRAKTLSLASRSPVGGRRPLNLLIVGEAAAALLLVIAASLFGRSFLEMQEVDPGFEAEKLLAVSLTINDVRYPERPQYLEAYRQLMEELGALPGVEAVASIRRLPMRHPGEQLSFTLAEQADKEGSVKHQANVLQVSPGFFRTAGVPLLEGRDFSAEDVAGAPPVVVVNEAMARRYWPGETSVGRELAAYGTRLRVIGEVGDVKHAGLDEEAPPTAYLTQAQSPRRGMSFLLRAQGNPLDLVPSAQAAVWRVDGDQPIQEVTSMDRLVADSTARPRLLALLLGAFAALAVLLALIGVYGVLAHTVSRRTHEIGVRVALGARRSSVLGMIIRQGMVPIAVGMVFGLGSALYLASFLEGMVFGIAPVDPPTYFGVSLLFVAISFLACYLAGRGALAIDPADALRED